MSERRRISSGSKFESEIGYSRAVADGDWVFVAGTTGFDYATMAISDDVAEQAEQAVRTVSSALERGGREPRRRRARAYQRGERRGLRGLLAGAAAPRSASALPAATMQVAASPDPRMKIEIEVTARTRPS